MKEEHSQLWCSIRVPLYSERTKKVRTFLDLWGFFVVVCSFLFSLEGNM